MKGRLVLALLATTLALAAVPPAAAGAAAACEQSLHLGIRWGWFPGFVGEDGPVYLYYASEPTGEVGTSTEKLTILAVEKSCPTPPQPAQADYTVTTPVGASRPATPGVDYDAVAYTTGPLYDHRSSPNEHRFDVTIRADGPLPEPVTEQARADIVFTEAVPETPQQVPLYIVDEDGTPRVAFETAGPYPQQERFRYVTIPVFRAGPLGQEMQVPYTVTGSSSNPATPGSDFDVTSPQPLVFGANERAKAVTMLLRADGVPEPQEEATVTLTAPGVAQPQDPVSATVQLIDTAGGVAPPSSSLHHPNQGVRYKSDDYRIREVHVFTKKGGGGAVTQAELALRMNRKDGCQWFDGKRFVDRDCQNPLWFRSEGQYEPDLFYYRMRRLKPSKGKIRDYTMFSRAIDLSRSVENAYSPGRNNNTFEVRPAKKKKKQR